MLKANPEDAPPTIKFRRVYRNPMSFQGSFWLDIMCRKHENSELYWQVFTVETNRFTFDAALEIQDTTFKIKINDFNFNIEKIIQNAVLSDAESKVDFINFFIQTFRAPVLQVVNNYMYNEGLSIDALLAKTHLDFISFGDTDIDFFDYYVVARTNPKYTFGKFTATIKKMMLEQLQKIIGEGNEIIINEAIILKLINILLPVNKYVDNTTKLSKYEDP
jgi:hypothetical protein